MGFVSVSEHVLGQTQPIHAGRAALLAGIALYAVVMRMLAGALGAMTSSDEVPGRRPLAFALASSLIFTLFFSFFAIVILSLLS